MTTITRSAHELAILNREPGVTFHCPVCGEPMAVIIQEFPARCNRPALPMGTCENPACAFKDYTVDEPTMLDDAQLTQRYKMEPRYDVYTGQLLK